MASKEKLPGGDTPGETVVPRLTKAARAERKRKLAARRNENRLTASKASAPNQEGRKAQAAKAKAYGEEARKAKAAIAERLTEAARRKVAVHIQGRNLPPCPKCSGPLLQCECRRRKLAE